MLDDSSSPKIKVLIVDDSLVVRFAAAKMLGDDFDIAMAVDGKDAWRLIQQDKDIQVIFTDLVMPEMDGFELLKTIRTSEDESINSLPVIVTTGADNPEIAKQKAISLGATDFVTKPFDATAIRTRALSYANLHQTNKTLQENTTLDALTGLMNDKGLHRQLDKEISFIVRHQSSMTVMAVEIDGFKDLFIRVGRKGSEIIIKKIADLITTVARREDTVARTGLGSFVISMPLAAPETTMELADQLCRTVAALRAKLGGKRIGISVSVGICVVDSKNVSNAETVLDIAFQALTKAQEAGVNQISKMTTREFEAIKVRQAADTLSIDQLLVHIANKNYDAVIPHLDIAIERMEPLFGLLSLGQKQRIMSLKALKL